MLIDLLINISAPFLVALFYWKVVIPLVGWLNDILED